MEQIDVASGTQVRVARAPQFGRGRGFGRRFRQGGYGGYGGPGFYPGGYGGYPGGGYGGYPGGGFGGYPGGFGNAGGFGGSSSQSQASAQSFNFNSTLIHYSWLSFLRISQFFSFACSTFWTILWLISERKLRIYWQIVDITNRFSI